MKYIRTKDGIFDKIDETLVLASKPPKYDLCKNGEHIKYEFCHNCVMSLLQYTKHLAKLIVFVKCLLKNKMKTLISMVQFGQTKV